MFCNAAALAALRMSDVLDRTDHRPFFKEWIETVQTKLLDGGTGLLPSSFTIAGRTLDGPEGSSIWFTAHCLQLIDEPFARDQYTRAKSELALSLCGFAYAREWPPSFRGSADVDSGPVIPFLDVSAGSSGMAFIAAAAFGDREFLASLLATLDFAAFPLERDGVLKYCASNQVGDAVLLYALVMGPLWEKIQRGGDRG